MLHISSAWCICIQFTARQHSSLGFFFLKCCVYAFLFPSPSCLADNSSSQPIGPHLKTILWNLLVSGWSRPFGLVVGFHKWVGKNNPPPAPTNMHIPLLEECAIPAGIFQPAGIHFQQQVIEALVKHDTLSIHLSKCLQVPFQGWQNNNKCWAMKIHLCHLRVCFSKEK